MQQESRRTIAETLCAAALLCALFASYGILKPVRDNVGQYFGRDLLPTIWLGTAITTVIATALLGAAVARWPRRVFAPWVFGLCAAITGATYFAYDAVGENHGFWLPAMFYCWVSSYLMIGLALFWGLMADLHGPFAGRKTFGPIAFAGTLGQLGGAAFTEHSAKALGLVALLGVAVALLLVATALCVVILRMRGRSEDVRQEALPAAAIGGRWFDGFLACTRSPYLGTILAYVCLQTFASAVLALEVVDAVKAHYGGDQLARTAFNARVDFWSQGVTLLLQLAVVGPVLVRLGTGAALAVQPLAYAAGFVALACVGDASSQALLVAVAGFEIARRSANYGLAKPARDTLFTVCSVEDKYKAKSVIDAAGFRVFDYVFAESTNLWRAGLAKVLGSGLAAAAVVTVPIALAWAWLGWQLGGMHRRRLRER